MILISRTSSLSKGSDIRISLAILTNAVRRNAVVCLGYRAYVIGSAKLNLANYEESWTQAIEKDRGLLIAEERSLSDGLLSQEAHFLLEYIQ